MKIVWIGALNWFGKDGYVIDPSTAGAVSASAFEQAIIEGLEHIGNKVQIISDWDTSAGDRFEWSHNGLSRDITVGGISTKYIRIIYTGIQLNREIKQNKKIIESADVVIIYSAKVSYLSTLKTIKKINPSCKLIFICPDLSEYMDPAINSKPIKKMLRKIETKYIYNQVKLFDGAVWFAEKMQEMMPLIKHSIVVEGVFSPANLSMEQQYTEDRKYVMYAGSLSANFGIQNIIKAFEFLKDKDLSLYIFGTGELSEEIQHYSENNPKICYKGFTDRNSLFEYEKAAMLLINARDPFEEYTKYSFPSKMFEYMVSGNPVLTTRLDGILPEYYEYVDCLENNSPEVIANHIRKWFDKTELERKEYGSRGKRFIIENKNKFVQGEKVNRLLYDIVNEGV